MHEFKWMLIISLWFFSTQTQSSTWNSISSCHLTAVFSVGHYNNYWPPELFSQRGFHSYNDLSLRSKPIMLKQGNSMANVVFNNSHSTLTEYMVFPLKQLWKIVILHPAHSKEFSLPIYNWKMYFLKETQTYHFKKFIVKPAFPQKI